MSWINRLRRELLHWHRRIGLLIALLVLLLVATGVALNHSEQIELDRRSVTQAWLLRWYALDQLPAYQAYRPAGRWLLHFGGNHLYVEGGAPLSCTAPFYGAIWSRQEILLALCSDNLLLLTAGGELIERISAAQLPAGFMRIGLQQDDPVLAAVAGGQQHYRFDLNTLTFTSMTLTTMTVADIQWAQEVPAPQEVLQTFWRMEAGYLLNWERLLLDVHSGRILGQGGVWLVDAVAIALTLLALSGSWLWLSILWGRRSGTRH